MLQKKRKFMSPSCPISNRRIDSNMVRFISAEIAITVIFLLLTQHIIFALLLLVDFSFRILRLKEYSPFSIVAFYVLKNMDISPRMSDEAPKRFALYLGWSMTILMTFFALLGYGHSVAALAWILLTCSLMEAVFEFCVGCTLYHSLVRLRIIRR